MEAVQRDGIHKMRAQALAECAHRLDPSRGADGAGVCLGKTRGEGLGFGGSAAARASAYTVVRWLFQQRCCLHETSAEAAACAASATSRCTRPSMDALEADQRAVKGWGWGLGVHACVRACGRARALLRGRRWRGRRWRGRRWRGLLNLMRRRREVEAARPEAAASHSRIARCRAMWHATEHVPLCASGGQRRNQSTARSVVPVDSPRGRRPATGCERHESVRRPQYGQPLNIIPIKSYC